MEDERIWMPSEFPAATRATACWEGLAQKEETLREAECLDALETIWSAQHTLRAFYAFRDMNVRRQAALTRAGTSVERQVARSKFAEDKYRRVRHVLLSLRGLGEWEKKLRKLENANVVSMARADFDVDALLPLGEGH